jgi:hypothetical protein
VEFGCSPPTVRCAFNVNSHERQPATDDPDELHDISKQRSSICGEVVSEETQEGSGAVGARVICGVDDILLIYTGPAIALDGCEAYNTAEGQPPRSKGIQMIRRLFSAHTAFAFRTLIASLAFCSVFSAIPVTAACDPVVYLFRHAEEKPGGVVTNTLLLVGQQHAELYPDMIEGFQGDNCPVNWVYAMSATSADGSIGTSNPYFTAYPSASVLPQGKPADTIGRKNLLEYLPGEQQLFLTDLKSKLLDAQGPHSVAVFWSSQGMCTVAQTLGSSLPNFDCVNTKPPRNSVFVFEYNSSNQTFARTGNFEQCFNFNPFVSGPLEDKFSFDHYLAFPAGAAFVPAQYYCEPSGNLADGGNPAYSSVFGTTGDKKTPAANGSITAAELSTLLRGQICDQDNPQDNCHL